MRDGAKYMLQCTGLGCVSAKQGGGFSIAHWHWHSTAVAYVNEAAEAGGRCRCAWLLGGVVYVVGYWRGKGLFGILWLQMPNLLILWP